MIKKQKILAIILLLVLIIKCGEALYSKPLLIKDKVQLQKLQKLDYFHQIQSSESQQQQYKLSQKSCNSTPQKTAYLSFQALSNRDYIDNIIKQLNPSLQKYNTTFNKTVSSKTITYNITNMYPQFYYNNHHQFQAYIDQQTSQVHLGIVWLTFRFDYYIFQNGKLIQNGYAHGKQQNDPYKFHKKITIINNSLQWQPQFIQDLSIHSQIPIDYSEPKLSFDDNNQFQQLINDFVGTGRIKQKILKQFNNNFKANLKKHLNSQHIFQNSQFSYKFKDVEFNYTHTIKTAKLVNQGDERGLFCQFDLEIVDYPQRCSQLPNKFNTTYNGGVQQYISMATLNATLIHSLKSSIFHGILDKKWDSKKFQFNMGDLGNIFPNADKYYPSDLIGGDCLWNQVDIFPTKLSKFDDSSVVTQIPYKCFIQKLQSKQGLFSFEAIFTFVVKIIPKPDQLEFFLTRIDSWNPIVKPLHEQFVLPTDKVDLAEIYIKSVMQTLVNQTVLGTGWKTISRRFQSVRVYDNYILLFDPSQK